MLITSAHTTHSTSCFLLLVLYVEVEDDDSNNKNNDSNSNKSFICHLLFTFNDFISGRRIICSIFSCCSLTLISLRFLSCFLFLLLYNSLILKDCNIFNFWINNVYDLFEVHFSSIFNIRFKLKVDIINNRINIFNACFYFLLCFSSCFTWINS